MESLLRIDRWRGASLHHQTRFLNSRVPALAVVVTLLVIFASVGGNGNAVASEVFRFTAHKGAVNRLAVSPDGLYLATAGADRYCYVLEARTFKVVRKYGPHNAELTGVAFFKDQTVIVSMLKDDTDRSSVVLWDWRTEAIKKRVGDTEMATYGVQPSPGEGSFAVTLGDSNARLYTLADGGRIGLVSPAATLKCQCVTFSPDGRYLRMGSGGGVTRWQIAGKVAPAGYIRGESDAATTWLAYLPDGKHFVSSHADGLLRLWREEEGTIAARFTGHKGEATTIAVSRDGKFLASGGVDKSVRIWNVASQKLVKEFSGHTGPVTSASFLHSGQVASSGQDGTVRVWSVDSEGASLDPPSVTVVVKPRPATIDKPATSPVELKPVVPPPELAQVAEAVGLMKKVFESEYASAKRPAEKLKLSEKLLAQSRDEKIESAERYALFQESLRLAVEAGNTAAALNAAKRSAESFVQPAEFRLQLAKRLLETVQGVKEHVELATAALGWAENGRVLERFDEAGQLAQLAGRAALKGRSIPLQRTAKELGERVRLEHARWEAYQTASKLLKDTPNDPQANLTAGRYFCFSKGDWERGVKHLAQGSGPLKEASTQELSVGEGAPEQLAVAEKWQTVADEVEESDKPFCLAAAVFWYERALPGLSGLQKLKAEQAAKKNAPSGIQRK